MREKRLVISLPTLYIDGMRFDYPRCVVNLLLPVMFFIAALPVAAGTLELVLEPAPPRLVEAGDGTVLVEADGLRLLAEPGAPLLPVLPVTLLLPPGEELASLRVEADQSVPLDGFWSVAPAQQPRKLSDKTIEPTPPDERIYSSDQLHPAALHGEPVTSRYRGFVLVTVLVHPVRYRPASGRLFHHPGLKLVLTTRPAADAGVRPRFLSLDRETVDRVRGMAANPDAVKDYLDFADSTGRSSWGWDQLIITSPALAEPFREFAGWKTRRGVRCLVVTLPQIYAQFTEGPDQQKIRDFITMAYEEWGTRYVLLGGDDEVVPHRGFMADEFFYIDLDCPADLYYGALDGTWNDDNDVYWGEPAEADYLPEVHVGRAPVDSVAEVENFVAKVIRYLESPVLADCETGLMIGEETWWDVKAKAYKEEIRLGTDNWGFSTAGFPPEFLVGTLYDVEGVWDATANLLPLLNRGPNLVNHAGHADNFVVMKLFDFMINEENLLNDGVQNGLSIIYSQGCYCGAFDNRDWNFHYLEEDAVGEELTTIATGAVACIMNSRNGWGSFVDTNGPSQYFDREFFDALFGEGVTTLGEAADDSKIDNIWTTGSSFFRYCYYSLNLLGDPEMKVWTTAPRPLQVLHHPEAGMGNVTIPLQVLRDGLPLAGARVCLRQEGDGGAYARGETNDDGRVWLQVRLTSVDPLLVTVTGPNCLPWQGSITPRSLAAWVGYLDHELDDDTSGPSSGDGNGIAGNGETVELSIRVRNYGLQPADGVTATLTSDGPKVTVISGQAGYGRLEPGASAGPSSPFVALVGGGVPDGGAAPLTLTVTDGLGREWVSSFDLPLEAPLVLCQGFELADSGGGATEAGNGILEPGEMAEITLIAANHGSRTAGGLLARVVSQDPLVEVLESNTSFGDLAPGGSAAAATPLRIRVSAAAPTPYHPQIDVGFKADWSFSGRSAIGLEIVGLGLAEDMEDGGPGWAHGPVKWTADDWTLTTQFAAGGSGQSWKCGPRASWETYSDRMDAALVSPPFGLQPGSMLTFWHAIDAEDMETYEYTALDGGIVEINVDEGGWEALHPLGGFEMTMFPFWVPVAFPTDTRCFSGVANQRYDSIYLDDRQGVARVRFRFGSDHYKSDFPNDSRGWFVDDVTVQPVEGLAANLEPTCKMVVARGVDSITADWVLANHGTETVSGWAMVLLVQEPFAGGPVSWVVEPWPLTLGQGEMARGSVDWFIPMTHGWDRHRLLIRLAPSIGGTPLAEDSFPLTIYGE